MTTFDKLRGTSPFSSVTFALPEAFRRFRASPSDAGPRRALRCFVMFGEPSGILRVTPPSRGGDCPTRKNRTLTDLVNAMLDTTGFSKEWWGETILTACHVLNRVPTKNKEITPFEEWEKKKANTFILTYMGLFGKNECANNQKM